MNKYPPVSVRWIDACGQNTDVWEPIEDAIKDGETGCTIDTVGYKISESKKFITLVMNFNEEENEVNGRMTIPKGWITELIYLEPKIEQPSNA